MVSTVACGASSDQGGCERFCSLRDSDANGLEGISVQIWEETASRLDRPFVYVPQPNSKANIDAVSKGVVDLAIGPISITPDRLANPKIDFTQPYFHGQEGLMIPVRPPSLWSRFKPFSVGLHSHPLVD